MAFKLTTNVVSLKALDSGRASYIFNLLSIFMKEHVFQNHVFKQSEFLTFLTMGIGNGPLDNMVHH